MATAAAISSLKTPTLERKPTVGSRARLVTVCAQKTGQRGQRPGRPLGYVPEDNSGRANIFAVEPRYLYTKSPTADRAARQGLGGQQGLLIVAGVIAVVVLVTLGEGLNPAETLSQVAAGSSSDGLSTVAARIAGSL